MNMRRRVHRGFILLMVLLIIPVIAVSTVSVARMSLVSATEAQGTQSALQRRWGQISCTRVFLPLAGSILDEPDDAVLDEEGILPLDSIVSRANANANATGVSVANVPGAPPVDEVDDLAVEGTVPQRASIVHTVTLGGQDFEMTFADEQAKVNINLLHQALSDSELLAALERLQAVAGDEVEFNLRPYTRTGGGDSGGGSEKSRAFASPGQVYHVVTPLASAEEVEVVGEETEKPMMADLITCWGGGQLNIRRARPELITIVAGLALKPAEIKRLSAALAEDDKEVEEGQDLPGLLDALGLTEKRRAQIEDLLIDRSACYSLGIMVREGQRTWRWLAVEEQVEDEADDTRERSNRVDAGRSANRLTGRPDDRSGISSRAHSGDSSGGNSGGGRVYVFAW